MQRNSVGTVLGRWVGRRASISIDDDFFVAQPTDSVQKMNSDRPGREPALTPGIDHLDRTIKVKRPTRLCWAWGS